MQIQHHGKVSPGNQRYTDITIDPTGTDVAVRYDITFGLAELAELEFITVAEVLNNDIELVRTARNTYTGIIDLEDVKNGRADEVRCFLTWVNNDEKDELDTQLGSEYGRSIGIPLTITVRQYVGETITEYIEYN